MNESMQLVEEFGMFMETYGVSRSAGLILGWLMLAEEAQSLDDIADGLGLSKASISLNTRVLEHLGVIQKIGVRGDRKVYYKMADHAWIKMLESGVQKLEMMRSLAITGLEVSTNQTAHQRFAELDDLMSFLVEAYAQLLQDYRKQSQREK